MNKKLAMLMFAIGLGASAAPAFSAILPCEPNCGRIFGQCINAGIYTVEDCIEEYDGCMTICG